jgi:lipid A 4'-phosphatase
MSGFGRFWLDGQAARLARAQAIQIPHLWFGHGILVLLAGLLLLLSVAGYHAAFAPLNDLGHSLTPWFWQNLTYLGDGRLLVMLALLLAYRRPELFWAMLLVALMALLVAQGLKPLVAALRPASVLEPGSFAQFGKPLFLRSFPSGHSMSIAAFVAVLWATWPPSPQRLFWNSALLLLALAVGLSRVAVGAHWPVDVVTGLAMGLGLGWLALYVASRWRFGLRPLGHGMGLLLCLVNSYSLLHDSGGYPEALLLGQLLVVLVWGLLVWDYGWRPFRDWRLNREARPPSQVLHGLGKLLRRWDVLLFLAMALVFLLWPRLDILVSSWFYQPGSGFFLAREPLVRFSYKLFANLHLYVLPLLLGLLIWQKFKQKPTGSGWFLLLALLLGPGLLVNTVFKEEWGRARPREVVEFGGSQEFSGAFVISNQCATNCSFVSGHAAMGFYLLALAWVLRRYWLWLGLLLGSVVGLGRLLQGGHFLSDVIFAFWAVYFVCLLLAQWLRPEKDS